MVGLWVWPDSAHSVAANDLQISPGFRKAKVASWRYLFASCAKSNRGSTCESINMY